MISRINIEYVTSTLVQMSRFTEERISKRSNGKFSKLVVEPGYSISLNKYVNTYQMLDIVFRLDAFTSQSQTGFPRNSGKVEKYVNRSLLYTIIDTILNHFPVPPT